MKVGKVRYYWLVPLVFLSGEPGWAGPVATSSWLGGTGFWSNSAQWDGGIPGDNYQALIGYSALSSVTVDITTAQLYNLGLSSQGTLIVIQPLSSGEVTSYGAITINNGGTMNVGSGGFVQDTATANTLVLSGASLLDSGTYSQGGGSTMVDGSLSTSLFHVTGGSVSVGSNGVLSIGIGGYTQDLAVTTTIAGGGQLNMTGDFSQGNGTTTVDGSLSTALYHVTGGSVTVGSGGTITTGSGGYVQGVTGTTTTIAQGGEINAGTGDYAQEIGTSTLVDGTISAAETDNSGLISGSGTIDGNFRDLGFLNPGDDLLGMLDIEGTYFESGVLDIGLAGPDTNSELNVSGAATLGGSLDISELNGFTPELGESLLVMTFGSETGVFDSIVDTGLPAGEFWTADYGPNSLTVTLTENLQAVPEAGTLSLSLAGIVLLFLGRFRSKL